GGPAGPANLRPEAAPDRPIRPAGRANGPGGHARRPGLPVCGDAPEPVGPAGPVRAARLLRPAGAVRATGPVRAVRPARPVRAAPRPGAAVRSAVRLHPIRHAAVGRAVAVRTASG